MAFRPVCGTVSTVTRHHRLVRFGIGIAVACVVGLSSCSRKEPEEPLDTPTPDRLAATPSAVGIPYDRHIVVRHRDRLVAVTFHAASKLGDRVRFEWIGAEGDAFVAGSELEHGTGGAVERTDSTGRIAIPGLPTLDWSRGSDTTGWIYWPERYDDLEIYSAAFGDVAEIDTRSGRGRWLRRPPTTG